MLGITRYIFRQLLVGMVLTAIGLACVLWLTQSLRFIELIVNRGLSIGGFIELTLLLLPNFLTVILPVSLFAVVLFTYSKMMTDRELVVLRAAGMSQWDLARPAVLLAFGSTLLCFFLGMAVIPKANQEFRQMQWAARNDLSGILLQEGNFNHVAPGLTVYVRKRLADGELADIIIHDDRDPDALTAVMAKRGVLIPGEEGPRVLLENGNRQEVTRTPDGARRMSTLYFDSYAVDLGSTAGGGRRNPDPSERPLSQLLGASEPEFSATEVRKLRVEAFQRLTLPLLNLTYVAIALACLLSGSFNRRGQSARVMAAIVLMVVVQAGALGSANAASKYLQLLPLIPLNAVVPMLLAFYVLLNPQQPRRARQRAAAAG